MKHCSAIVATVAIWLSTAWLTASRANAADRNPAHLRMGLVSMKSLYSAGGDAERNRANIETNLQRHLYFIDKLAADGVEFIGFPELSINGYQFSETMTWLSATGPEVKLLQEKAVERGVYLSAGLAEQDPEGKRWNTQIVIDPGGQVIARHHKIYLTNEKGFTGAGSEHRVFAVKGIKVGIVTCADGTDRKNLQALVDNGAQLIYGPHCNSTGGTTAGWYRFRAAWGGPNGWIAELKVHAALHNNAGLYNADFAPPRDNDENTGWASGAWFIGPDGRTLTQMPSSTRKSDSKEFVLVHDIPLATTADRVPGQALQSEHRGRTWRSVSALPAGVTSIGRGCSTRKVPRRASGSSTTCERSIPSR
jgi:predicted amidohydrolase